jgi:hypothetical protein
MALKLGDASAEAVKFLQGQGIELWSKPRYEIPVIPKDLTAIDDDDLMLLFSALTAWSDHINGQVSASQVDERSLQKRLSFLENSLLVNASASSGRGDRITILKAAIACDPKVMAVEEKLEEAYAYRKMIESVAENLDRDTALVSRELTRRTSFNNVNRNKSRFTT